MHLNNGTVTPLHLLLLEDHAADADLLIAGLRRSGVQADVKVVGNKADYLKNLDPAFDAIISDFDLPQFNAKEALALLQDRHLDIPFIVVSGAIGEETAVDLMKLGAADYLLKDRLARLPQALAHAVDARLLRAERVAGENDLRESEERMRAILESALDAVVTMNHAGEIVELNPASEKMFGFSRNDALGKRVVDLIIPERVRDDHNRGLDLYLKTGEARMLGRRVEVIAQRMDGSEFPAEMAVMRIGSAEPPMFTAFIRDIGEGLRAKKTVRESEERLQRVIANLREGLVISDMQGELLDWNPAALEMHGITSADQSRFRLADCAITFELRTLDGTILPLEKWPLPRIIRGERLRDFEARVRHLGTDWERVLSFGGAIVNDATWGQLAFVTINDVTEQRQAESARREADEHLTDIINSVEGIVWETDEATNRMTFISEKAEEILGYPTARWLAEPGFWRSHLHPDDQEKAITSSTAANGHSPPSELEYRMVSATGREVWFKDRVSVVKLPGRSVKHRGIMLDVTERKRAEVVALAGEAQIREQARLLDLAHDAIMVRDMNDRIEFWNLGAATLYGWTAAEVRGKAASGFLVKDEPVASAVTRASFLENGKWTGECKHVRKDGGHLIVRSRWTLVRDDLGAPKSILIINTDITDQKRIEEQFLRAQRLESIGTLASGVAHDLNNILAPILMGAAVLRRGEMQKGDEAILSTIETCAQRGADIVKQVLTFARGAEGARLLVQPAHLINDMAKIAEGTFPKSITVQTDYPPSLWPIEGDPTQLHQILLNLCVNARDAMPAGGALTISAVNFSVDEHYASMTPEAEAGPHVLFEVKDTGMGIPREIIDQIYDPFFTTKELGRGTGLGLSTVIGIIKSHGGFVSVDSEIGRGTTFKVYLPAQIDARGPKENETVAVPRAKGELLLIVDDEKSILKVARELLEGHGYQVLTAGDATEALAFFALRKDEIKLVLTDLAMPLMDGIALIRTLQKMQPGVGIVASTGRGSPEYGLHELSGLHVRACLTKPYTKEMLLTTLHDALSLETSKL